MKRFLLFPFLFFSTIFVNAQIQPVSCDLFISGAEIQDQSGLSIDANTISFNQIVKYQFTLGNLNQTTSAPQGHFRVSIGLGTGTTLNPGFNLSNAGLNNIFNWTYDVSGSQPRIIGTSIGAFPAATDGTVTFELKAATATSSTISTNFLVTNPQGTQTPLSDPNFSNNSVANAYSIATDLILTINTTQNVTCFGGNNGSISASATGGYTPYVYSINPTAGTQSGGLFTNLPANVYTVTVTDASNNNNSKSTQVSITQPTALTSSITSQTNVACFGGSTGNVTVAGANGTPGYTYSIDGTTFQTSGTFNNLPAGSYSIIVKDANNCTTAQAVTITQPVAALTSSITSQTNVACFGNSTGSVTVAGANGTPGYTYSIDGTTFQTSGTFTGLPAGTYNIIIKDVNNCTTAQAVTITQPAAALTSSITSQTNVACFGGSTGNVTVAGANGTPGYTYSIDGTTFQTSGTFSGLSFGSYSIIVKDANNCTIAQAVSITQPAAALTSSITSQTNVACFGNSTGSVTVAGANGTPGYTYSIDGTTFQTSGTFTGLPAGSYSIIIKDANNCTTAQAVTITQPATAVSISLQNKTNNTCNGGNNGSITVTTSGGVGSYNYVITSGTTVNSTGASSGIFTGLAAGTYSISSTDANGCTSIISGVAITQPTGTNPDASLSVPDYTDNFFTSNGDTTIIVYQITENEGNPITTARLRTTKQGSSYNFSLPNRSSITIQGVTYPLANANWTQNNSTSFYDLTMNSGTQVPCGQSVYLAVKITRNTTNKSTFTLTSVIQQVAGETNTSTNSTTFVLVAQ